MSPQWLRHTPTISAPSHPASSIRSTLRRRWARRRSRAASVRATIVESGGSPSRATTDPGSLTVGHPREPGQDACTRRCKAVVSQRSPVLCGRSDITWRRRLSVGRLGGNFSGAPSGPPLHVLNPARVILNPMPGRAVGASTGTGYTSATAPLPAALSRASAVGTAQCGGCPIFGGSSRFAFFSARSCARSLTARQIRRKAQ